MSYRPEEKELLSKRKKLGIAISITSLVLGVLVLVISMFFVSDSSLSLIKVIDSISLSLLLSLSLYFLLEVILPSYRRETFLNNLEKGGRKIVDGKVVSISGPLTVYHNVKAYHVEISHGAKNNEVVKVDSEHPELLPNLEEDVSFTVSSGFVVEVDNHE